MSTRHPENWSRYCRRDHDTHADGGRTPSGQCRACRREAQRARRAGKPRTDKRRTRPKPPVGQGRCHAGLHEMTPANTRMDEAWGVQCQACWEKANPKRSQDSNPGASLHPKTTGGTTISPELAALARRSLIRHQHTDLADMLGLTESDAA